MNQEIAVAILENAGFSVEVAENGQIAVDMVQKSEPGHYQAVLMDVQMPVMDGYQATRRIRALPRRDAASVWIVAMTANAFVEDIRRSRQAGMNEHISKPVELERLQDVLSRCLKPK